MNAELGNDFNFTRKLLSLSVDGATGGSLDDAIEYGGDPLVTFSVKTIVDVGIFDSAGNLSPVPWTTTEDSLNLQRDQNPYIVPRYPTDGQVLAAMYGTRRITFTGDKVFYFPKVSPLTIPLGIEAYTFTPDWTEDDLDDLNPTHYNAVWNQRGSEYLMWQTIIHLNHVHKHFVFRQEGNLPPPEKLSDTALANLVTWDNFKYQQFRRHRR
jgi:hypothetical protein